MTEQHLITPPDELVEQWASESLATQHLCTQGARWGADQELEACVNYIDNNMSGNKAREFRAIRRPKPPSDKELALAALERQRVRSIPSMLTTNDCDTILRALEALPE